ncbi:hypothetical protein IQ241_09010 [Romeria aff. gracilis LEGE 07310]|uniref:Uncharacterized protein n=1 Tax=Vasconcelosia minhoensis LEGE 07310 TaxID=915328 RepID=A0A8J7DQZ8_9CYAN|nr:hypothetical protein [Romeria gracilis]MBE9077434.1 hypothetical protein [Romeria aff. gracilis LEGE 07310]
MSAFVGTQTIASADEFRSLINQLQTDTSCFFLRWPHQVSGFCRELPSDFPSPEGQMFDSQKELRWKRQGKGYSVLLLSADGARPNFKPVGPAWAAQDREAHLYPKTETRFPQGVDDQGINVGQRYFLNPQTATVHFVALVVR